MLTITPQAPGNRHGDPQPETTDPIAPGSVSMEMARLSEEARRLESLLETLKKSLSIVLSAEPANKPSPPETSPSTPRCELASFVSEVRGSVESSFKTAHDILARLVIR